MDVIIIYIYDLYEKREDKMKKVIVVLLVVVFSFAIFAQDGNQKKNEFEQPKNTYGLQFEIYDFDLESFRGSTISYIKKDGKNKAISVGVTINGNILNRNSMDTNSVSD